MKALPKSVLNHNMVDYDHFVKTFDWKQVEKQFSWYKTGKVNMAYEAVDRHVAGPKADQVALHYSDETRKVFYTFRDLRCESNRAANVLKEVGVTKGDRVFVFMPRTPELYTGILGALKLGAIVGPLFEAFMESAVYDRLQDSGAKVLLTTPDLLERVPFDDLPALETVLVVADSYEDNGSFLDYKTRLSAASNELEITWVDKEDGLILHYTSGSTGKPKGVLHAHGAMVQHLHTAETVLDLQEGDVYWCTADPGWVTGTSYGIFAPWLAGATTVVRGGRFSPRDWYEVVERYGVTVWYSAPTAFRMLMGSGDALVAQHNLSSLRHVLSVGEPLNPEVIRWGMDVFGKRIHDTWWMTETGAQMICNYPTMDIRLGSMGKPIPGVEAAIVDDAGKKLPPNRMGNLALKAGWPSMMRAIWNNKEKYESYFIPGDWYVSGDSAYMDEDGYFWFQGRVDDVIMTAGERVGPFEVESKLIEHPAVAEAGVIGKPDPVRGEIIKAFIALRAGYTMTDELDEEIRVFVRNNLAAHAAPREIECRASLPKTRSGKIMRRVLKAWELNLPTGDLSTMDD
ncbi:acetate--CoA ligase [Shouchella lonarensis]|uniref:acetate--CoA ligase n=1 Tax=Shouchella lonarensis TaxID=1464122 RepID=A0A1G6GHD9_9BACI|nr:acetate--CoA ligase [Shouchella lonarensis]SDB81253.1 acetyl-CoA synthetase [Shouchella lonarensis]